MTSVQYNYNVSVCRMSTKQADADKQMRRAASQQTAKC